MQHKAHPKFLKHTIDDAEKEEMSQVRYITIGLMAVYSYFLSLINRLRMGPNTYFEMTYWSI